MIEKYIINGVEVAPSEWDAWAAAHPEAFLPPLPSLDQAKATKTTALQQVAYAESQAGVLTTPGLTMKYGEQDCVLVDGIVRYTELKGLSIVPKLIEADGTVHTDISLADGQTILLEQFEAANAADTKLRTLVAQVQAATSVADVEAVEW